MKPLIYLDGPDMQIDISEYPGYLGLYIIDTKDIFAIKELPELADIPIKGYWDFAEETNDENFLLRKINVSFTTNSGKTFIEFDLSDGRSESFLAEIIDELPSVEVCFDDTAYVFFLKDGFSFQKALDQINEIAIALKADYKIMKALQDELK